MLFTDGEPTGGGSDWNTNAQKSAETNAKALRDAGYTVYTIGFALNDRSKTFLEVEHITIRSILELPQRVVRKWQMMLHHWVKSSKKSKTQLPTT